MYQNPGLCRGFFIACLKLGPRCGPIATQGRSHRLRACLRTDAVLVGTPALCQVVFIACLKLGPRCGPIATQGRSHRDRARF